jgi:hypothetical protein
MLLSVYLYVFLTVLIGRVLLRTTNYADLFSSACTYVGFLTLLIGRFQRDFDRSVSLHLALKNTRRIWSSLKD